MEHLINITISRNEDGVGDLFRIQIDFLENHVLNWVNVFSKSISAFSNEGSIYKAIAPLFTIICKADCECIRKLI